MITVPDGGHHDLVLEISDHPLDDKPADPDAAWEATSAAWEDAVPKLTGTIADRDARHAYAVMRGLTSSAGGMVAAATMGLPERAEEGRNYDYRYAWIRIVLQRPGHRRGRRVPAAGHRGWFCHRAGAGRRAPAQAGVHRQRGGCPASGAAPARLPGRLGHGR